ncbi:hypothetical protein [Massilia niabensis]|uniref:Uncharacterized protein n=1 Tax=Massilia niabensis TaxID=544910 RepID=A0ABW0L8X0_9BURK
MQATAQTDPGFKLPEDKNTPDDPLPKTTPDTAAVGTLEVQPGAPAPATDTSTRDAVIGGGVFLVLLVVFFFARNAFVHHLVVRRVAPSTAGSAGWLLYLGLGFLSAAAVLAIVNASKYLTLGVTGPLVFVGLVTLVAAFFIGRR